ncbi:MAG: glycoside hydrolase family 127 protein [Clostridiales bacterium]|nr:glycoside hydrolase family 127 protein [Clostridiales bacterium]
MKSIALDQVTITDKFWGYYNDLVHNTIIPYQYESLNDRVPNVEPSYAIHNLKVAAGAAEGSFGGFVFQDSDLAKWLEAAGYSLSQRPNPALEKQADEIIAYMAKAQQPDGYLNTYYILNDLENRFTNLRECHELYCLGHLIEAAVAYYEATRKREFLDVVRKYADLANSLFGPEEGKQKGCPGHQEIELALVKLYDATGERKYLDLAKFFLDTRGTEPNFFLEEYEKRGGASLWDNGKRKPDLRYCQAHMPVRSQKEAAGHAVRAVYMYTGMAMTAERTGDASLKEACETLWDNIVEKQMYITGGIGQTAHGEAFTFEYDLPNDTIYSETCAAIGLIFFSYSMLMMNKNAKYADVIEKVLYNTVLAGIARDGKHFFYVNPLEVWPDASEKNPTRAHVKPRRPGWFPCACCPPNIARLLASLGKYIYTQEEDVIFTHLFIGGEAGFAVSGGRVTLTQDTMYPADGTVTIGARADADFTLALRLPAWCAAPEVSADGGQCDVSLAKDGYLYIKLTPGEHTVRLNLPMEVKLYRADTRVRANAGKAALCRGPLVYCLEQRDNGENLSACAIKADLSARVAPHEDIVKIYAAGRRDVDSNGGLYSPNSENTKDTELVFVPYFYWGNRSEGEMAVWIRKY